MQSGIVVYRRNGTTLEGRWAHENTGAVLAKEIVSDVPIGACEGDWPVKIFIGNDDTLLFTGRLSSTRLGDCLKLTWQGNFVDGNKPGAFQGLGQQIDGELIAACFEPAA
jgi:hypothetical protein